MAEMFTLPVAGTLGTNTGAGSDGVQIGALTAANPSKALLKGHALAGLCRADDGGVFTDEDTPFNEATADDVEVLPATPAAEDACYFGHATSQFARVDVNITTQGDGVWTIAVEYWNGSAWTAVSGLTDGTTSWTAATGWKSITFTLPGDWATTSVNSTTAYWIRTRVSAYTSVVAAPQVGQGYIIGETASWTDDTTDMTDAGAGDVDLLPAYPVVGDGFYFGHATEKFCKLKVTTSQERTGTATLVLKYWNGSAMATVTTYDDDSVGWSGAAGTHLIHFVPPSDWALTTAANGPNGEAGYFVAIEMIAIIDVTQQPLATQGWIFLNITGASGVKFPRGFSSCEVCMSARTVSGSTQDSTFLLVNTDSGESVSVAWSKALAMVSANVTLEVKKWQQVALVQVTEDGTTELANASFCIIC